MRLNRGFLRRGTKHEHTERERADRGARDGLRLVLLPDAMRMALARLVLAGDGRQSGRFAHVRPKTLAVLVGSANVDARAPSGYEVAT